MVTEYCSEFSLNVEISSSPEYISRTAEAMSVMRTPRSAARWRSTFTCSSGLLSFMSGLTSNMPGHSLIFAVAR